MQKLPRVIIIGRANTGKSTLFNRLSSSTKAIVSDIPGTTRDRKEANVHWLGRHFTLVDTGGLNVNTQDPIEQQIAIQTVRGLSVSDLILFVCDARDGITSTDQEIAVWLRKQKLKLPILVVVNKADNQRQRQTIHEFNRFGLGQPWPISAVNGSGTGDLLDHILTIIKSAEKPEEAIVKVAIVGKPNVGKSSLINSLLNEERMIVSPIPHTTRDAQDIDLTFQGQKITLIDTAGIRRRFKKSNRLELASVGQAAASISRADVVLLMTEAHQSLSFQDKDIADQIIAAGSSVIIIGNKWDLLPDKSSRSEKKLLDYYHGYLNWLSFAPLVFLSAKEKTKKTKLLTTILEVNAERSRWIDDNAAAKLLHDAVKKHLPSRGKGTNQPYIYTFKQVDIKPPTFVLKIKQKTSLHQSYLKFLENSLRRKFGFTGTPIKIYVEKVRSQ